jgi:hypothetical protein
MVDIVLAGDPLGLKTGSHLRREVRHTYPELVQAAPDSCSAGPAIERVNCFYQPRSIHAGWEHNESEIRVEHGNNFSTASS